MVHYSTKVSKRNALLIQINQFKKHIHRETQLHGLLDFEIIEVLMNIGSQMDGFRDTEDYYVLYRLYFFTYSYSLYLTFSD